MTQLTLGLVQTALVWEDPRANREQLESRIAQLTEADLIVLPEMFSTGFSMASAEHAEDMSGETLKWLMSQVKQTQTAICGSLMLKAGDQYFNRFMLFAPDRAPVIYDKRHLFRMADEHHHYTPGSERVVFEYKGVRICPQVCYDLRFPVFSRNRDDYDLLLYVANWPARRSHHWRTLLTARAIENLSFVAAVNRIGSDGNDVDYCGDSGLIHPNGDWIADLDDQNQDGLVKLDLAELEAYRASFPAWQDADDFSLA